MARITMTIWNELLKMLKLPKSGEPNVILLRDLNLPKDEKENFGEQLRGMGGAANTMKFILKGDNVELLYTDVVIDDNYLNGEPIAKIARKTSLGGIEIVKGHEFSHLANGIFQMNNAKPLCAISLLNFLYQNMAVHPLHDRISSWMVNRMPILTRHDAYVEAMAYYLHSHLQGNRTVEIYAKAIQDSSYQTVKSEMERNFVSVFLRNCESYYQKIRKNHNPVKTLDTVGEDMWKHLNLNQRDKIQFKPGECRYIDFSELDKYAVDITTFNFLIINYMITK
jgi:hypothetical protein